MHTYQSSGSAKARRGNLTFENGYTTKAKRMSYKKAKGNAVTAMSKAFPQSKCSKKCIEAQLDNYHNQCGIKDTTQIKAVETGQSDVRAANQAVSARNARLASPRGRGGR